MSRGLVLWSEWMGEYHAIRTVSRPVVLFVVLAAITAQHYLTGVSHDNISIHNIHYLLYFLPILMASIWYGLLGGALMAALVSVLYAPVVFGPMGKMVFTSGTQKVLEIVIYNVVGWVTGFLSQREKREREHYRKTAEELGDAYQKLQRQTDVLIEKEEQLRRAEKLSTLGELAAGIAHEIRNPLASIKGSAEILQDPSTPQAKKEEFARVMLAEIEKLNRFVVNFLELGQFKRLNREDANLNDIIKDMLGIVDFQLKKKGIVLKTNFAELPHLQLDVAQMEHAILNLLLNAVSAMPNGGALSLTTASEDHAGAGRVRIDIVDTGEGIPPEHLPHVYDPFFTTKSDGTGLGLSVVRRVISAHDGAIEIRSELGKSTRATLIIPVESENAE